MVREFGSEFSGFSSNPDYYFRNLIDSNENILFLRSGREALGAIAQKEKGAPSVILVPAYACSSMITPFTFRGWNIIFYPVKQNFAPDLDYIGEQILKNKISAILFMNYWNIVDMDSSLSYVKSLNSDIITIVDQTHAIFSLDKPNLNIDYKVGSIRKWMGISDGAYLMSKKEICIRGNIGYSLFSSSRVKALQEKAEYNFSLDSALKTEFRDVLGNAENILNECQDIYAMSLKNILKLYELDCSYIKKARLLNYRYLVPQLLDGGIEIAYSWDSFDDINVPFSIPIVVENRDIVQKQLAVNGVYAPVLWPVTDEAATLCHMAKLMSEKMLSIPIDQRYTVFDMNQMAQIIIKIIKECKSV